MESYPQLIYGNKLIMAQVLGEPAGSGRKRPGTGKAKKLVLRIDMTPMVDLGFLLISFFVFSAELAEPRVMKLHMPKDSAGPQMDLGDSYALTVLLDGSKNYYYQGNWNKALLTKQVQEASILELRQVILQKQRVLDDTSRYREGRAGLMLLVKPSSQAGYASIVDVLDEAVIANLQKYALLPLTPGEKAWLKEQH